VRLYYLGDVSSPKEVKTLLFTH
jgi:hypothetical protein